ncbi:putative reverse transcriptase domain-containing protein [Tanacetum coccineum]
MPPRRAPVARRALVARRAPSARTANNPARNASTTTDAPMSAAAINQLIETRVAEALANQEQLRNNENQVKFATCTFIGNALTWWNPHKKAVTQDVSYAMDWKALKKMMTVKYCPKGEIKKLEIEL